MNTSNRHRNRKPALAGAARAKSSRRAGPAMAAPEESGAILRAALQGRPLRDYFVADCHGHLGPWSGAFAPQTGIEDIIAMMDEVGIAVACLNAWNCPDQVMANNAVGAAVRRFPKRIIGFARVEAVLRDKNRDELRRCFEKLGMRGIKVHEGYDGLAHRNLAGFPDYRRYLEPVWQFAHDAGAPVLCHGHLTPEVARAYPGAQFILAHAGGNIGAALKYRGLPNVFFDTAATWTLRGNIEFLAANLGARQVLYGSDLPYSSPARRLGQVIGSRLPDAVLKQILGDNLARLLGLPVKKQ